MSAEAVAAAERDRLFGLAYRMLGSVADAEEVVQEALLRLARHGVDDLDEPAAWLTTVTTNLCLDHLRSARVRREEYVGPWLPEPLVADRVEQDPAARAEQADDLTLAFLVVLESLSPDERAVFLLHDVFGHPHDRIAAMLDRTPASVRKLASRARQHVDRRRPRHDVADADAWGLVEAFLSACAGGDLGPVMALLAPDVVWTSDGGGLASAATRPLVGPERVARFAAALVAMGGDGVAVEWATVNGVPGAVVRSAVGVEVVLAFRIAGGRIAGIDAVRNPEKLRHLDP